MPPANELQAQAAQGRVDRHALQFSVKYRPLPLPPIGSGTRTTQKEGVGVPGSEEGDEPLRGDCPARRSMSGTSGWYVVWGGEGRL
jgi:hypothetical protein